MTQGLRVLTSHTEEPSLIPEPTWLLRTICNSSSKWSNTFFGLFRHQAHVFIDIHIGKMLIHIKLKLKTVV